jgi:hypothetical protein
MTQLKKLLLLSSCVLLAVISGCGSAAPIVPNGRLYASNSFRPGSTAALTVTTGALADIVGSPFVTTGNAPFTLVAWPPFLPAPATAATAKFLYAGVPASPAGGVINRILHRPPGGSVTGGILMMPINSDHTLGTAQLLATGGDYDPVAVTPNPGNFLYAIDLSTNRLVAFSIDSSKGTLTAIGPQGPPPGVAVGPDAFNVVVDPQGKFVFVANCDCINPSSGNGSISVFAINNGTLAPIGNGKPHPIAGGAAHPSASVVSPDGKFLFVASLDDNVYVESINAADGTLTDVACPAVAPSPNSTCALPAGSMPVSITVSIDGGNSVYTANAGTRTVSFFLNCETPLQMVATGTTPCPANNSLPLLLQSNGNVAVGGVVGQIIADPSTVASTSTTTAIAPGHFLYVTDYDNGNIAVFSVTSTTACTSTSCPTTPGTLNASGSAVNTGGGNPYGMAFTD